MRGLSVVIPSKNAANLNACLGGLNLNQTDCRIICIDDGIDISEIYDTYYKNGESRLDILKGEKPFVFARNCNIGIRAAGDDDVILLNDDALLKTRNGLSLLQRAAEENKEYGCIGAVTNVTGQPLQRLNRLNNAGLREVPHIAFICVLIPRRTIDKIGLLDERYCIDYGVEDRDYCEAIRRAGMKVGVHDGCFVDHASLLSTYRGQPNTPKSFEKNFKLFKQKWSVD